MKRITAAQSALDAWADTTLRRLSMFSGVKA